MQAIEFETDIVGDTISIPDRYRKNIKNHHIKVILMYQEKPEKHLDSKIKKTFNPKDFFGASNVSKKEIDAYLKSVKDEWE